MPTLSGPHNTSSFKKGIGWKIALSALAITAIGVCIYQFIVEQNTAWFNHHNIPYFAPAPWFSKLMWIISYLLIGGTFGIVWHIRTVKRYPIIKKFAKGTLILLGILLVLNFLFLVFLIHFDLPILALIDMLIISGFTYGMIRRVIRLDRIAAFLLLPYLLWIIYGVIVTIGIVAIN